MVGKNIRDIRREKGVTQWQLCKAVNVTPATITLIERGIKHCSPELAHEIAKALNVPNSRILGQ